MSADPQQPPAAGNLLLARISTHERNAVLRDSEAVSCAPGNVLLSANTHSEFVYFPVDMVVSTLRTLRDGSALDVGLIGAEGMIGLDVAINARTQLDDAVVQSGGSAYRLRADDLRRQFDRAGSLQKSLLRFMNAFLAQVAQNVVCGRFHTLDGRVARWLLMIHDRTPFPEIRNPVSTMALALGVPEEAIAEVLGRLAETKALRLRRQSIRVDNSEGLEIMACECYETIRQIYARTLAS